MGLGAAGNEANVEFTCTICMRRWDRLLTSESEKVTNEVSTAPVNAPTSQGKTYNGSC